MEFCMSILEPSHSVAVELHWAVGMQPLAHEVHSAYPLPHSLTAAFRCHLGRECVYALALFERVDIGIHEVLVEVHAVREVLVAYDSVQLPCRCGVSYVESGIEERAAVGVLAVVRYVSDGASPKKSKNVKL